MPAVTPDRIFQAALQKLEERFTTLAFPWSPLVEKIISGKQVEQKSAAETPYIEFRVLTDGPGETHQLISGGELYPTALKDVVTKGNIYGTRLIHVYEIPGADMAKAAHPQGCEELIVRDCRFGDGRIDIDMPGKPGRDCGRIVWEGNAGPAQVFHHGRRMGTASDDFVIE